MRVVMIHALEESVPPVKLAFAEEFPEAQLINLLDQGLFIDFAGQLTPQLHRRMTEFICYAAAYGADAIGLACSVFAPVVDTAKHLVDVPLISSYSPVMEQAIKQGTRIGIIASVPATLRDSEYYLRHAAAEQGVVVEPRLCLADDLLEVMRTRGEAAFNQRLAEEVSLMEPEVDAVLLGQFSFATALSYLQANTRVPVLSGPRCSARRLKEMLSVAV
ncbi:MAG: aspartate/glutamate racemase family protein [Dehalococcoidia bacterium]